MTDPRLSFFLLKDGKINDKVPMVIGKIIERKKINSEPVFSDKYLKTKIKSYIGKIPISKLAISMVKHPKKELSAFVCQQ